MCAHRVIAIDGPAASGKSSVARQLAKQLGLSYVNSGALYRAVTWQILQRAVNLADAAAIGAAVAAMNFVCEMAGGEARILLEGENPQSHLRDATVNAAVSRVSSHPRVREIIAVQLRRYASSRDLVMEGRDIGSVVFPQTPFKFYIDASPEIRARRRAAQGERDEILARDRADSSRLAAPLIIARDASFIDTSALSIAEVVAEILRRLAAQGFAVPFGA